MKTSRMKSIRFMAAVAIMLFIGTSLAANVKIYQYSNYKGKIVECGPGEHSISKFSRQFSRTSYISIKLPSGYSLDVDYYGRGWRKGTYRTYTRNVSKLRYGFKKIRIRKNGNDKPDNGERPNNEKPVCSMDWGIQFFQKHNYQGDYDCFPEGFHNYKTSFRSAPLSFRVKSGYEVILYKYRRVVKKIDGNVKDARYDFDQFKVQKKEVVVEKPDCGDDWVVKFYKNNNYQGEYVCYPKGEHKYKAAFKTYPQSIQVKKGYKVLVMSRGRKVKEISGSARSVRLPSFDVIVMSALNNDGGATKPIETKPRTETNTRKSTGNRTKTDNCVNNWKLRLFPNTDYKGERICYFSGTHQYSGQMPRSMMVANGYEVILYRGSRLVKVVSGGHTNLNINFDKLKIQAMRAQTANGLNCGSNWTIQLCNSRDFSGPSVCYPQGKHSYRPGSLGYPKSVQVKRGYYAVFKYRGRIVNTTPRSIRSFSFQFDEVEVKKDPKYLDGFPVSW